MSGQAGPKGGSLDSFVDKVYYINLEEHEERRASIKRTFEKANVHNYERMPGVRMKFEDVPKTHGILGPFSRLDKKKYVAGNWGCRLAHLAILRDAIAKGYSRIAVFEDDLVLVDDFDRAFAGVRAELDRLPQSFAIAYLALFEPQWHHPSVPIDDSFTKIQSVQGRAYGAFAYIVNNQNGSLFSELVQKVEERPIELDLCYSSNIYNGFLKNRCYMAWPLVAEPGQRASSVSCPIESFTVDEFVGMTYYINKDEDVGRREHMERQFATFGISNYRRIPAAAVTWEEVPPANHLLVDVPNSVSSLSEGDRKSYVAELWSSRMAHLACLQDAQKHGVHCFAVFEDDCTLAPDFKERFSRFGTDLNQLGDDFEVCYFNLDPAAVVAESPDVKDSSAIRGVQGQAFGARAYMINNRGNWVFPHIVRNLDYSKRHFHGCLSSLIRDGHLVRSFVSVPALVTPKPNDTPSAPHGASPAH